MEMKKAVLTIVLLLIIFHCGLSLVSHTGMSVVPTIFNVHITVLSLSLIASQ